MKHEIPFKSVQSALYLAKSLVVFNFIVFCEHREEHEKHSLMKAGNTKDFTLSNWHHAKDME